jgi:hypothetical protein
MTVGTCVDQRPPSGRIWGKKESLFTTIDAEFANFQFAIFNLQ